MNRYYPTQEILNAITALDDGKKIIVRFQTEAVYSAYLLEELKKESNVVHIIDAETGEVLYIADN